MRISYRTFTIFIILIAEKIIIRKNLKNILKLIRKKKFSIKKEVRRSRKMIMKEILTNKRKIIYQNKSDKIDVNIYS